MPPRARPEPPDERASAPSAARVLQILEFLAEGGRGFRASELARDLGLPKSSVHLLLNTLVAAGWIDFDAVTHEFTVGLKAWEVGQTYHHVKSLTERASPHMDRVRADLGETVRLAVLDGTENVYIAKSDGGQPLALDTAIGSRLPAYATGLGKVLLSGLSQAECEQRFRSVSFQKFTPRTIGSLAELQRELATILRRGYGEDREEYALGVRCVAVPVRDWTGRVVAAMSVSVPSIRFRRTHRAHALALLKQAAALLSRELGAPEQPDAPDPENEAI